MANEIKSAYTPLKLIRSGNGKRHAFDTGINEGRSYIGTICGKTVFRRRPPIYDESVSDFNHDDVDCKNCKKATT